MNSSGSMNRRERYLTDATATQRRTMTPLSCYSRYPDVSVCDVGYCSEENYLYAFKHGIETFIKYNYFHKEQKRSFRNDPFLSANFYYNEETDGMYCPMEQSMDRLSDARRITDKVLYRPYQDTGHVTVRAAR